MAVIHIDNLAVRTIIGTNSWERKNKQDIVIHITLQYDGDRAGRTDSLKDALDYQAVADKAIRTAQKSRYFLLEKLAAVLLKGVMADKRVQWATVRLDKPHAIAQAKNVSVELSLWRK